MGDGIALPGIYRNFETLFFHSLEYIGKQLDELFSICVFPELYYVLPK